MKCPICGKPIPQDKPRVWGIPRTYCSRKCATKNYQEYFARLKRRKEERIRIRQEEVRPRYYNPAWGPDERTR